MRSYIWCTYREWSFQVLEGLLDLAGWRCDAIVTTPECLVDLDWFRSKGIPVVRIDPKTGFRPGGAGAALVDEMKPEAAFWYGWSWIVPTNILNQCYNTTLHPGKLPKDRGGSPIQNQIRNGETWSYANLIELVEGLDEGDIYTRERFSLEGDEVDAVWARMVSAGVIATRRFLAQITDGSVTATPQDSTVEPTIYKRVQPADAELKAAQMTAHAMYNIVRAHNETDPNSYVVRAWLEINGQHYTIDRASLNAPDCNRSVDLGQPLNEDPYALAHSVNNGETAVFVSGKDGKRLYFTRYNTRLL